MAPTDNHYTERSALADASGGGAGNGSAARDKCVVGPARLRARIISRWAGVSLSAHNIPPASHGADHGVLFCADRLLHPGAAESHCSPAHGAGSDSDFDFSNDACALLRVGTAGKRVLRHGGGDRRLYADKYLASTAAGGIAQHGHAARVSHRVPLQPLHPAASRAPFGVGAA